MIDLQKLDLNKIKMELDKEQASYNKHEEYFRGANVHIIRKEAQNKPDNRVPTPFVNSLVNTLTGYAAKPGNIRYRYDDKTTEEKETQEDNDFVTVMNMVYEENDEELYTSEQYEEASNQGKSFEVFYTVPMEEGNISVMPYFMQVPAKDFYPFYSDKAGMNLEGGIWFREWNGSTIATLYTAEQTTDYIKGKDDNDFSLVVYEDRENPLPNEYGIALCNEYTANKRRAPFWQPIRSLVDAHDEATNKALNELERFSQAILLMAEEVGPEFVQKLKDAKIIDNLGDSEGGAGLPRYLERNINDTFFQFLTDHYETLIYQMSGVVNLADENFAQNASGVAILYKMQGMEYQAAKIDAYFDKGIKRRFEIIRAILQGQVRGAENYGVEIKHDRTLPPDLLNLAQVTRGLTGILSQETILGLFPKGIVPDPRKEKERLEAELAPFPGVDDGQV